MSFDIRSLFDRLFVYFNIDWILFFLLFWHFNKINFGWAKEVYTTFRWLDVIIFNWTENKIGDQASQRPLKLCKNSFSYF